VAERGSILGSLWDWVSPKAAEAEVMSTPSGQATLAQMQGQPRGDYLLDMYRRIYQRAQGLPQTVSVLPDPQLKQRERTVGDFDPAGSVIRYQPGEAPASTWNTLGHELLHFLNAQTSKQPVETQHALMDKLLAASRDVHPAVFAHYQPPAFSPVEHSIINEWMGGPRDWPR
jgi:hypothetical protein